MPGQPQPPHDQFRQALADIEHRLQGVEHQQQMVITDPTGASGDPAHGHAVMVTGSLKAICGIAAFGCAVWSGSAWVQVPTGLVLSGTALLKANDLSDLDNVVTALTNLSAPGSPTASQRLQILWGTVTSAGAVNAGGSGGVTVTKGATGIYTLNWTQNFANTGYGLGIFPVDPFAAAVTGGTYLTTGAQVTMRSGGVLTNGFFVFLALGVY